MKFLILFAVGVLFGCVQCDQECFRKVFKECVREPVPMDRMTLCDGIQYQVNCLAKYAKECNMKFDEDAALLNERILSVCTNKVQKEYFDKGKACYKKSVNVSECAGPMVEAMSGVKTFDDNIRANKKICNLLGDYSECVNQVVLKDCGAINWAFFSWVYDPLDKLDQSLCQELILPADEKDSRPDNFGNLNAFMSVIAVFASD